MAGLEITWNGKDYVIGEDDIFLAADAVENVVTVGELVQMRTDGNKIRFVKLAQAFAALLREAGCNVTDRQVHKAFTDGLKNADPKSKLEVATQAIDRLLFILFDGAPEPTGEGKKSGNEPAPAS